MKKVFGLVFFIATVAACQSPQPVADASDASGTASEQSVATPYGQALTTASEATPAAQVPQLLEEKDSLYMTLSGTALSSCAKKGCWMTLDLGQGENMRVTFKDYGFFVPKDLNGEQVVVEGMLRKKISSIDEQRHYAEDAGLSKDALAAIQEADTVYAFEAVGVLVYPTENK